MRRRAVVRRGSGQGLTSSRQKQGDGRTVSDTGIEANLAAGLLRKPDYLAEPEPRALSDLFCREKRLEGLGCDLPRHARSGVVHGDRDIISNGQPRGPTAIASSDILCRYRDPTSVRHRIAAVDRKIQQNQLQL